MKSRKLRVLEIRIYKSFRKHVLWNTKVLVNVYNIILLFFNQI